MNVSQGPPQPPVDQEAKKRKLGAALWSAVWEASQLLSEDEIMQLVASALREIESDEP